MKVFTKGICLWVWYACADPESFARGFQIWRCFFFFYPIHPWVCRLQQASWCKKKTILRTDFFYPTLTLMIDYYSVCVEGWPLVLQFLYCSFYCCNHLIVTSEIFASFIFAKTKPSWNDNMTLSFTDVGKLCPSREFLTSLICLLTLFAKNKILTRISEFTVHSRIVGWFTLLALLLSCACLCSVSFDRGAVDWSVDWNYRNFLV